MNQAPLIKFTLLTLFPEALQPYLDSSMLWKAQARQIIQVDYLNLRDFGLGPHRSVDDTPYGGGDGMLLRCEPIFAAVEKVKSQSPAVEVVIPTPVGRIWTQALARQFAGTDEEVSQSTTPKHYLIICPHYEGYDQRILTLVDHQICLGPYILTGGELPALIMIDSITRLLPGVLSGATSAVVESFSDGNNLEYPQYTKPADFRGLKVPEVLLSGHHGAIAEWRARHSGRLDPELPPIKVC